jgi:hypothetical protein
VRQLAWQRKQSPVAAIYLLVESQVQVPFGLRLAPASQAVHPVLRVFPQDLQVQWQATQLVLLK